MADRQACWNGRVPAESNDRIGTRSVHRDVVETSPIVLRELPTVRLLFLPALVDKDNPLRGCFVYQRRTMTNDPWGDVPAESLNQLKAGEGVKLELRSEEIAVLMDGLIARKSLYEKHGIVWGEDEFIRRSSMPELVQGLIDSPEGDLASALEELAPEQVVALARRVDLSQLDVLIDEWLADPDNPAENHWQQLLAKHSWVFSQLTGSPVVVLSGRAYVGGKGINNRGGGEVDFLVRNALTHNVSFVEIKTPRTPLVGEQYRTSGAFSLHKEVSGGVVQVLGYRDSFEKSYTQARVEALERDEQPFRSNNPRCILIAGRAEGLEPAQIRSFELFRGALTDVTIWTFDEVVARLRGIRDVMAAP
jgi:hypothetical protein